MCHRLHFILLAAASGLLAMACGPSNSGGGNQNNIGPDAYVFPDAAPRPDARACEDRCTSGDHQCVTGGYQECGNFDSDSCSEWGPVVACNDGEKCIDGSCQIACTDECTDGSVRCNADGTATQTCSLNTSTNCWEWGADVACNTGETCSGGQCSASCTDECTTGSRRCDGDGVQICGNFDSDDCTDWGPTSACNVGETCSDGFCDVACSNECTQDAVRCDGTTGVQACGDFDSDPCLEWGPVVPCAATETCSNGACDAAVNCEDECPSQGATQCTTSGGGYQECDFSGSDACLHWGLAVSCDLAGGETCSNGACVVSCDCDFHAGVCEAEAPGSSTACACDGDCGTACGADGHCDTWCPSGTDPDCDCSCDFNEYCEAAAQGSSDTCACDPDCELNEWACDDDGHCDTWCPSGVDPDCNADPCRERDMTVGYRTAEEMWLSGSTEDPDSVEGSPWVLLSPNLSSGEAELWVEFAEEHSTCVSQITVDAWGYDDSVFGDGAEVYLYNWSTYQWDLLPNTFDAAEGAVVNTVALNVEDYLLCGSPPRAKCYIDAKFGASAWDNTHLWDSFVYVHMTP